MRCCDNCIYSCKIDIMPDDLCIEHQYIEGLSNEKNYVLYDNKYLGEGYFIINEINNEIKKFIKIYIINYNGFPQYCLRAFGTESRDNPDSDYTNIEFVFRNMEDHDNGLYNIFLELASSIRGNITSTDEHYEGKNNISFILHNKGIVRMIVSKDIWRGRQHPTDFIDINIGDNYTCINYEAIKKFYNYLSRICSNKSNINDIKRILKLN